MATLLQKKSSPISNHTTVFSNQNTCSNVPMFVNQTP